jgi:hypothetical protein
MLCKIWGFHSGDYEECHHLGYKSPVRTSQETHYISTRESNQLMLCKIWGVHGRDYEECRPLGCGATWVLLEIRFGGTCRPHLQCGKNPLDRNKVSSSHSSSYCQRFFYIADSFHPEDGGIIFLRSVYSNKSHTALHLRRRHSSRINFHNLPIVHFM